MASDLSKLIQDSLTITLAGLLAKDAKILKVTKAHPFDIEDTQLLQVESTFDFSNFSSKFSYLVPAKSASLIFNTMMGSPITDLSEEIDDDAEDAINEFVSNACGGLTTTINAAEFQDVGQTKFNISHKEILNGNDIKNLETTFRFEIDLEDHELILYINFDEAILDHITEIASSEITVHQERKIQEEEPEKVEEISTQDNNDINEEKTPEEEEEIPKDIDPKTKKLKLLVMIIGGVLSFVILSFFILLFMGVFDDETPKKELLDINTTKKATKKVEVIQYPTLKKVDFKTSDINKERINKKLEQLTKYQVLNKEELEAQKLAEKNRLFELEREKELLEFSKKNHEEPVFIKEKELTKIEVDKKTQFKEETFSKETPKEILKDKKTIIVETTNTDSSKIFYAVTNSLKYSLFKTLVQETKTAQARISICNDTSGETTIYIGPFESKELRTKMIELTESNNIAITAEDITEKDFNLRCNLE